MCSKSVIAATAALSLIASISATYDPTSSANLAVYWGAVGGQMELGYYCNQSTIDIINVAFIEPFPQQTGGIPGEAFGNQCWGTPTYPGSNGATPENCPLIQEDLPYCQKVANKKIVLSVGGGTATYQLTGKQAGIDFGTMLWQMYGPYNASYVTAGGIRPLDRSFTNTNTDPYYQIDVDGFDFDIEVQTTDDALGYIWMIKTLRSLFATNPCKKYVITGAPQCSVPDAIMDNLIQEVEFDALYVQFYNTQACSARTWVKANGALNTTDGKNATGGFTYDSWVTRTSSGASQNAKIYLGLLGAPGGSISAPGDFLWPEEATNLIETYVKDTRFGGVMLWDATWANGQEVSYEKYSGNYYGFIKSVLNNFAPKTTAPVVPLCPSTTSTSSSASKTSTTTSTTTSSSKTSTTTSSKVSTSTTSSKTLTSTTSTTSSTTTTSTTSSKLSTTSTTSNVTSSTTSSKSSTSSTISKSTSSTSSSTTSVKPTTTSSSSSSSSSSRLSVTRLTVSLTSSTSSSSSSSTSSTSSTCGTSTSSAAGVFTTESSSAASVTPTSSKIITSLPSSPSSTESLTGIANSSSITTSSTANSSSCTGKSSTTSLVNLSSGSTSPSGFPTSPSGTIIPPFTNSSSIMAPTQTPSVSSLSSGAFSTPSLSYPLGPSTTPSSLTSQSSEVVSSASSSNAQGVSTTSASSATGNSSGVLSPSSSSVQYTTSTVRETRTYTITSCAPTVTNCPAKIGHVTTETIDLYTTICPITATEGKGGATKPTSTPVAPIGPTETGGSGGETKATSSQVVFPPPALTLLTTSTVYSTKIYTITSCAPTVTDCPARLGSVTTDIISLYTTVCPVVEATSTPNIPGSVHLQLSSASASGSSGASQIAGVLGSALSTTTLSSTLTAYRTVKVIQSTATVVPTPPSAPYPTESLSASSSGSMGTETGLPSVSLVYTSPASSSISASATPSPITFTGAASNMRAGSIIAVVLAVIVVLII